MSSAAALKTVAKGEQVNPVAEFRRFLERQKLQIAAALPRHISADRMIRLACTEFSRNPTLQKCTPISVFGSLIQASQLGLEVGVLGQAYLVPYFNKRKGVHEAQLIPGYKGLIGLARRSGEVTSIETHIVYEQDRFELTLGIDSKIEHVPNLDGERGRPRLVYGVAKFKDGGYHLEWMTIGDVEKIRARSKASNDGPWLTDYEQMVRKTLIRRMANYLPMSIELQNALQVSDAAETGKQAFIDGDVVVVTEDDDSPATDSPTPPAEKPAPEQPLAPAPDEAAPAPLTFAQVMDGINKAADVDALDLAATGIERIVSLAHRKEARDLYLRLRAELSEAR